MNDKVSDVEFLKYIVKTVVEFPDEVKVKRTVDDMGILLTLTAAQSDMGRIIGKSGTNASAIRNIMRILGLKNNARINVKIVDPLPTSGNAVDALQDQVL